MNGNEIHQNECRACRKNCLYSWIIQNYDIFASVCIGFDAPPKPSLHTQICQHLLFLNEWILCLNYYLPLENEVTARRVSGSQLTASSKKRIYIYYWSHRKTYCYPRYASLGYTSGTGGWMPASNNIGSEYLEVWIDNIIIIIQKSNHFISTIKEPIYIFTKIKIFPTHKN